MSTFNSLGLREEVLQSVAEMGFETPTPVQAEAIPVLLGGDTDLVALAQTGTGKTAAFGLPMLTLLDFDQKVTQALILAPTRELCIQISKDIVNFAKHIPNVNVVSVYGGASITNQIAELKRGAHIVVATPGRLVDLIDRKRVHLENVRFAVLDEADEMLNMGFKDDLDTILSATPNSKSTWLFSATMPDEVLRISRSYMTNPYEVTVAKNQSNENIEHTYYMVSNKDRYLALKRIADFNPDIFAIVFCRTKIETQQVADMLIKDGYNADALHGDLSQAQRDHVMNRYRSRNLQMLVATDVAARGIDVNDVTHVINYNLPDEIESYTHRSGRTARAGKKGVSIVLLTPKEQSKIRILERLIKTKFTQAEIPNGIAVCKKQLHSLMNRIHDVAIDEVAIESFLPAIYEQMKDVDKEEILKRFVSLEFNRFLDYYKNAPDLNLGSQRSERGERGASNPDVAKLFINIGRMDNIERDYLSDFIVTTADISPNDILWIGIKDIFSFVEVKPEAVDKILNAFSGMKFKKRPIRVEVRSDEPRREGRGGGGGGFRGGDRRDGGGFRGGNDRRDSGGFRGGNRDGNRDSNRRGPSRNDDRGGSFGRNDRPADRSQSRPTDRPADRSFGRSNDRPSERSNDRPITRSTDRPATTTADSGAGSRRRFDFSFNNTDIFDDRNFSKRPSTNNDKRDRK